VEIRQTGFKSWLTSIDVEASQNQLVRVVLEPIGKAAPADATLAIASTPGNLEVVVDGKPLTERTPVHTTLPAGDHMLVLRRNGADVWRQEVEARPSAVYEFNPVIVERHAEREPTRAPPARPNISAEPATAPVTPPATPTQPPTTVAVGPTSPIADKGSDSAPAVPVTPPVQPLPPPVVPTPPPVTPPPVTPPPTPVAPVNVSASAVSKLSGRPPNITQGKYDEDLPAVIVAKVCIDTSGHVMSAGVVTKKLDSGMIQEITGALTSWQYAPYKKGGVATPACFFVSFRTRS
jgi:hypothetical protein